VKGKTWLDKHYGVYTPGKSSICDWYSIFKRGRTVGSLKRHINWVGGFDFAGPFAYEKILNK